MMRKSGLLQIAEGLREREHGLDDSWKELYRWFVKDEQSQETLKQMIEAVSTGRMSRALEVE